MDPDRWHRITGVFHVALTLDDASRQRFLAEACDADAALRAEVETLLAAHREAGGFGERALAESIEPDSGVEDVASADAPVPEPSRPRPRRFRTIAWGLAAATATAFILGAVTLAVRGGADVGWTEQQRNGAWYVQAVDPNGPAADALQRGDRVLGLNGAAPARGPGTRLVRGMLRVGERYTLTVERGGVRREADLAAAVDHRILATRTVYFLISLVWCGVGLFVGFVRPDRVTARLACVAAVATGLVYLAAAVLQIGPSWGPLHVAVGYHFFCRFPSDRRPPLAARWTMYALYAIATPPALLGGWLTWTILLRGGTDATRLLAAHAALFPIVRGSLSWATYCIGFFATAAVAAHNYRRLTDEDARRRVRWVAVGSVAALVPQVYSAAVAASAFWFGPTRVPALGFPIDVLGIAIPLSVAYAVVRHRVFDVSVVVRRGLQYLLARRALQLLVATPLVALTYTVIVNRHETIAQLTREQTGYLFWIAAAALTLQFRRTVRGWLDRRFFREEYDRERVLLRLLEQVSRVDSIPDLLRLIAVELESALHPKALYLWHRGADGLTLSYSSGIAARPTHPPGADLVGWLGAHGGPAPVPLPLEAGVSRAEHARLVRAGVVLIIPVVHSDGRVNAVVMLGEKRSDEPYGAGDRRLLDAIAKEAAIAGDNLRLRAEISDEQRIRRDVLSHLDRGHLGLLKECPACGACYDGDAERCTREGVALTFSLPVARTIENRYRLDALLGRGGMGAVYAARDLRLQREVAVKILLPSAFGRPSSVRRFGREARAAARLRHPNIVSVHDAGPLDGGGAYLVMERVAGQTLRVELNRRGALSRAEAGAWFAPLLDGLATAHASGIVHRDLKPENVMGSQAASGLMVKILDFGLAKIVADDPPMSATLDGAVVGTSGYMSPEQILGREVDARTDIFAVGVMLAETLTGAHPFGGATRLDVARAALEREYHLPADFGRVDAILQRCLAKDPSDRVSSAAELRVALVPALA